MSRNNILADHTRSSKGPETGSVIGPPSGANGLLMSQIGGNFTDAGKGILHGFFVTTLMPLVSAKRKFHSGLTTGALSNSSRSR